MNMAKNSTVPDTGAFSSLNRNIHSTRAAPSAVAGANEAPFLVSIIISNYNYGRFVAQAIDSALNLDWPTIEIIVVDDGSTDDSASVIRGYSDRVLAIFQENGGQCSACNTGFARASGEAVIFLDSDDLLDPSLVRELVAVWRKGISKVQFQMKVIDSNGLWTGSLLPQYTTVPEPGQILEWALATGIYPTPPGSGNAYARTFLERIFPLSGSDPFSDSYCLAAAPFLGDVVTIAKPLVSYRVHGSNDGAMTALPIDRFSREVTRTRWRFEYAQRVARDVGMHVPDTALHRCLQALAYRLASQTLLPERHPIADDTVLRIFLDLLRATFVAQGVGLSARLAFALWGALVTISPARVRKCLVLWRFASPSRPQLLRRALRAFGVTQ